ncbi:MAG: 50S ribosomal protein L11 methyltransferase [Holosporaceae bacterium]|jgi:ribosomal protein L11 methyltransferase|nr:50S ribosomal protein L11 methyltransferase [Holosporaceae bacterium]
MSERIFRCIVGSFSIKEAFEITDLLFEKGHTSVSCAEKNNKWFVEILGEEKIEKSEISAILQNYSFSKIETTELKNINWLQKCFENFRPLTIGNFYIYGPHLRPKPIPADKMTIEIAAATAFGTGEHPTTNRCLVACQTFLDKKQHKNILDLGCGSGILSIALAKLGACRVYAFDNDGEAIKVVRENIAINKVASGVEVSKNQNCEFSCRKYDFIVANILAEPLISMSNAIVSSLDKNGILILSGFTVDDGSVLQKYRTPGLILKFRYDYKGWTTLVFKKKENPLRKVYVIEYNA